MIQKIKTFKRETGVDGLKGHVKLIIKISNSLQTFPKYNGQSPCKTRSKNVKNKRTFDYSIRGCD